MGASTTQAMAFGDEDAEDVVAMDEHAHAFARWSPRVELHSLGRVHREQAEGAGERHVVLDESSEDLACPEGVEPGLPVPLEPHDDARPARQSGEPTTGLLGAGGRRQDDRVFEAHSGSPSSYGDVSVGVGVGSVGVSVTLDSGLDGANASSRRLSALFLDTGSVDRLVVSAVSVKAPNSRST